MRWIGWAALALAATPLTAQAAPPDLSTCEPPVSPNGGERTRTTPLPVPKALRPVLKSSLFHYAIATRPPGTICIDTSWKDTAENIALSPDGRFLAFDWMGYETAGHIVVDRTGKGQIIETGVAPVFSPSRALFASVEISESGFGALNAFAVWRVLPVGVRQVGQIDEAMPAMADWRIDRWSGESCIQLSALPLDAAPDSRIARTRFAARPKGRGWAVARGACPSA